MGFLYPDTSHWMENPVPYPRLSTCLPHEERHNFYDAFHKALRLGHCRMLTALGAEDFSDAARNGALLSELRRLIVLNRLHLELEDREIHPALEARRPGAGQAAMHDAAGHAQALAELESLIRSVEVATQARRSIAGHALYRCYALFAAADMSHMNEEETKLLGLLHQLFSDAELQAIEGRMLRAIPLQDIISFVGMMMPAQCLRQRVAALEKLRSVVTAAEFRDLLKGGVKAALDECQCRETLQAIGALQAA